MSYTPHLEEYKGLTEKQQYFLEGSPFPIDNVEDIYDTNRIIHESEKFFQNIDVKNIPIDIREMVYITLRQFPQLEHTPISFMNIQNKHLTTMMSFSKFWKPSFFNHNKREFVIGYQRERFENLYQDNYNGMIGHIAHEFMHTLEYKKFNTLEFISFGKQYFEGFLRRNIRKNFAKTTEYRVENKTIQAGFPTQVQACVEALFHEDPNSKLWTTIYPTPQIIQKWLNKFQIDNTVDNRFSPTHQQHMM